MQAAIIIPDSIHTGRFQKRIVKAIDLTIVDDIKISLLAGFRGNIERGQGLTGRGQAGVGSNFIILLKILGAR